MFLPLFIHMLLLHMSILHLLFFNLFFMLLIFSPPFPATLSFPIVVPAPPSPGTNSPIFFIRHIIAFFFYPAPVSHELVSSALLSSRLVFATVCHIAIFCHLFNLYILFLFFFYPSLIGPAPCFNISVSLAPPFPSTIVHAHVPLVFSFTYLSCISILSILFSFLNSQ